VNGQDPSQRHFESQLLAKPYIFLDFSKKKKIECLNKEKFVCRDAGDRVGRPTSTLDFW
jgi:hypothetical protein